MHGDFISPTLVSFTRVMFDRQVLHGKETLKFHFRNIFQSSLVIALLSTMISPLMLSISITWIGLATFATVSILAAVAQIFLPDLSSVPMFTSVREAESYYSK